MPCGRRSVTVSPLAAISAARSASARAADSDMSTSVALPSAPCRARASTSRPSRRSSTWSSCGRRRSANSSACGAAFGLAAATSSDARIVASGVRSSCEALATNRRWAVNDASSRSSSPSMVSARYFTSSSGPVTASRSPRSSAEMRRVRSVIRRSGRSTRLASIRPASRETTAMAIKASSEPISMFWDCCASDAANWSCNSRMRSWAAAGSPPAGGCCPGTASTSLKDPPDSRKASANRTAPEARKTALYRIVNRSPTVPPRSLLIHPACTVRPNSGITSPVRSVLCPGP